MSWPVAALLAGTPAPFRDGEASAIAKQPLPGKVAITKLGLAGDHQADRKHHGGPDMALHIYPLDHHEWWRGEIGEHPLLEQPGSFGSNIAVSGIDELTAGIGTRFRLGTALIEVTRPRQPCWKIEHHFGAKGMVRRIVQTGRCGWLMRVLEEGTAEAGDALEMVEAGDPHWHVARTFAAIWGQNKADRADKLRQIAALPALAEGLRASLARAV